MKEIAIIAVCVFVGVVVGGVATLAVAAHAFNKAFSRTFGVW